MSNIEEMIQSYRRNLIDNSQTLKGQEHVENQSELIRINHILDFSKAVHNGRINIQYDAPDIDVQDIEDIKEATKLIVDKYNDVEKIIKAHADVKNRALLISEICEEEFAKLKDKIKVLEEQAISDKEKYKTKVKDLRITIESLKEEKRELKEQLKNSSPKDDPLTKKLNKIMMGK